MYCGDIYLQHEFLCFRAMCWCSEYLHIVKGYMCFPLCIGKIPEERGYVKKGDVATLCCTFVRLPCLEATEVDDCEFHNKYI